MLKFMYTVTRLRTSESHFMRQDRIKVRVYLRLVLVRLFMTNKINTLQKCSVQILCIQYTYIFIFICRFFRLYLYYQYITIYIIISTAYLLSRTHLYLNVVIEIEEI